ncbi:hypothetical protein BCY86_02520 [Pajaroellobacter abortibovis]|uniref:3-hydroxyisobutyrate dehydrogenase-like NAD-binding domain-containing protein n=1 Tax=Pajaroellobacter abortibovis TaxID=1882918 RepID=A0A1L6MVV1_9BACT|nr:hypothetical protein BCY86_02520 [Pajaroellobacter abortibovis]
MSTIAPAIEQSIAQGMTARGIDYLDAPVSGGDIRAQAGILSMMVGGKVPVLERARPVLEVIGRRITHCSPHGTGQATKLCNQILVGGRLLATCKAILFAQEQGLDPNTVIRTIEGGTGDS